MTLERLSALMDGELDRDQETLMLGQLKTDDDFQEIWNNYHLIGEVLRHQELPDARIGQRISVALANEPTVLVPAMAHHVKAVGQTKAKAEVVRHRWAAVAAAVAVVSVVTWFLPGNSQQSPAEHMAIQHAAVAEISPASTLAQADPTANEEPYVAMHRQWSPISGFQTVDYSAATPQ